jgi:Tol biopolymer transport system component
VAVIFATGPLQDEGKDKIPALANDGPESPAGIPVLQVKTSLAEKWLGFDLKKWQEETDKTLTPSSRRTGVRIAGRVDVEAAFATAENLAGIVPGRGDLAREIVVVGAHYDHLGFGGKGSMRPNENAIHYGADDNASGTAAVLAVAEQLRKETGPEPRRTIVIALFAAEETGLGGSSWFVAHSPVPMDRVVAMLNLDMVGNMNDNKLIAFGAESAAEWADLIARAAAAEKIDVTSKGDGYGPSDQTSFYAARVPVLHFFTGAHDRYHTPDDTADRVNYHGLQRVVGFTTRVARELAAGAVTPKYARASAAPSLEGDSRGYGSYLGTVPDYSAMEADTGGVQLSDVRPGSPAEKAGIRGGDRIVEMAGIRIENLYDMTFALQDHKPGETISVIVIRDGVRTPLRATLGSRSGNTAPGSGGHGTTPAPSSPVGAGKPFEKKFDGERHLTDIRQLTFGGENAEAYFSPDGTKLIYQATVTPDGCDQQYVLDLQSGTSKLISSGKGRTTCGYFSFPVADRVIYATTESGGAACPPEPDRSRGYVWPVYSSFELVMAKADGSDPRRLTNNSVYDAEATWCHKGGRIVFTSARDGDLDIYEMDENGGNLRRLTSTPGYDGGAFYNADCTQIVWRASRPAGADLEEYRALLADGLVKPSKMELFVANADGSAARQITANGAANFCPYFTPDGKRIIYSSNAADARGRDFDLYIVSKDGGEPERITFAPAFDGFPMFSPDGKWLVWASNRANPEGRETNLFIARWVD